MFERAFVVSSCLSLSLVFLPLLPFIFRTLPVLCPAHDRQCRHRRALKPLHSRTMRSIAVWQYTILSQVTSPSSSTTSTTQRLLQDESGDTDTEPPYSCDAELDDDIKGKAPSSPLFIQEREEPANLRQAYHSREESLLPAQSFFTHTKVRGDPYTN